MFRIIFAKIFFNGILFLSLNIYAQNFTTAVSGNFQSGYKIYDNYNFTKYTNTYSFFFKSKEHEVKQF